jgi:hypothetical protein
MKTTMTMHLHYVKYHWDDEGSFELYPAQFDDNEDRSYIGERKIEIEVPDNYDPRAQQIAALEKKKQQVMADYQKTVTEINARISNLQALEYTA